MESLALARIDLKALQTEKYLDPLLCPHSIGERVERGERVEGERMVRIAEDVVVLGSAGMREHVGRVVLVKQEDLRRWISEELRHEQSDQRRLARPRRPQE